MEQTVSRDDILLAHPLVQFLEKSGVNLIKKGGNFITNRCAMNQHKEKHFCVSIDALKQIWYCNDCQVGGSVIDWIAVAGGKNPMEVFKELAKEVGSQRPPAKEPRSNVKPTLVKTYDYTDEHGNLLYQVCRYHPKTFKQRQPVPGGGWKWTMDGAVRVPYRLPEVIRASTVIIAEGEKDCDTLFDLGFTATCNVCGAEQWLDAYSHFLAGKDIIIVPDNDDKGTSHAKIVAKSLDQKANSIKVVPMPSPFKDATEFAEAQNDKASAMAILKGLFEKAVHSLPPLPIYTIEELEREYINFYSQNQTNSISIGAFLPSLKSLRPLIPGELMVLIASTGVGKSALASAIARSVAPHPTLFFQLEIPKELMFERFAQMENNCPADEVENFYRKIKTPVAGMFSGFKHILVCAESGLSADKIEKYIERSALKFGRRPLLVIVDYIGLMRSDRRCSRYEAVSDAAEGLRVIAKRTNTVVMVTSQIARPDKKNEGGEIGLHDAKESGSIENSATLVLGAWRPERDKLKIKVLKATKGGSGTIVECDFHGDRMQIEECSKIDSKDVPKQQALPNVEDSPFK